MWYQKINLIKIFLLAGLVLVIYILTRNWSEIKRYRLLSIDSTSMEPGLSRGALVVVKTGVEELNVGQIVTFKTPQSQKILTHRLINHGHLSGTDFYTTQGDSNPRPDPWILAKNDIFGPVVLSLPWIGYMLTAIKTPIGFGVGVVTPGLLLVFNEIRLLVSEIV